MVDSRRLKIGLHRSTAPHAPEVKYVFRTLLRVAGYPHEFVWAGGRGDSARVDLYYGPNEAGVSAAVFIPTSGRPFSGAPKLEPRRLEERDGVAYLDFGDERPGLRSPAGRRAPLSPGPTRPELRFSDDIIFGSYWLLTGARETFYRRDRWDNLHLDGSFFFERGLAAKPLVSIYGRLIGRHFARLGDEPLGPAWAPIGAAAFAFTHDVDYPQMIRSIECVRLLWTRGVGALGSVAGVIRGTNHFWKFNDWVEFEKTLGARPAFYFMARKGSLFQYASGTPDAFYDITAPEFVRLFRYLRDEGCEIGLHASYHAHQSGQTLREERQRLAEASGVEVLGNRHHYWHLDADAPHDTLLAHEDAGLLYDSSLAFEFYPGFRRGICHPFRVFHPGVRRELKVVQLPPAWMDDHFDRRLVENRITDPAAHAQGLIEQARATGGTIVVDYHVRGMNGDFYPRYGPWLVDFVRNHLDSRTVFRSAHELVQSYLDYERRLEAQSVDATLCSPAQVTCAIPAGLDIGRMRPGEIPEVARLHHELFGVGEQHGYSLANLGREFLERVFYGLNVRNPLFFVHVARYRGNVVGFSVFTTRRDRVLGAMLAGNLWRTARETTRLLVRRPGMVATLLSHLRYLSGEPPPSGGEAISGWWMVAGVRPECRTVEFERAAGAHVAAELFDEMERTMREHDCAGWQGIVRPDNPEINVFLRRRGALHVATAPAQGLLMNYYVKTFDQAPSIPSRSGAQPERSTPIEECRR